MVQEMQKEYQEEIATLQEKLKEMNAILATLTQINEDLLKGSPSIEGVEEIQHQNFEILNFFEQGCSTIFVNPK